MIHISFNKALKNGFTSIGYINKLFYHKNSTDNKYKEIKSLLAMFSEYKEAESINDILNPQKSMLLYKRVGDIISNSYHQPNKQDILWYVSNKIAFINYVSKDYDQSIKELKQYESSSELSSSNVLKMQILCEIMKGLQIYIFK